MAIQTADILRWGNGSVISFSYDDRPNRRTVTDVTVVNNEDYEVWVQVWNPARTQSFEQVFTPHSTVTFPVPPGLASRYIADQESPLIDLRVPA